MKTHIITIETTRS